MQVDISKQEAWRMLDALECYEKDSSVSVAATKTIKELKKKLKKLLTKKNRRNYESFCKSITR